MNRNEIAKELAELGQDEARNEAEGSRLDKLQAENRRERRKIQRRRCKLLSSVACHPDAGLSPDVVALAAVPKERPADD